MLIRVRSISAALLLGLMLTACSSEPRALLLIDVSDVASGKAVEGAKVQAETASRNHPLSVASLLGQTGPVTSTGYTDAAGQVRLDYLAGRPVRVVVLARRYPILTTTVDEPWEGPTEELSEPGDDGRRLGVRIRDGRESR